EGLAYTTTTQARGGPDGPDVLSCPDSNAFPNVSPNCKPNQGAAGQLKSGYLFYLSSYFLNGFATVGNSGISWGVGDRGAIERLGGDATTATLPPENAPSLGSRQTGPAPDTAPYQGQTAGLNASPGEVPPRA